MPLKFSAPDAESPAPAASASCPPWLAPALTPDAASSAVEWTAALDGLLLFFIGDDSYEGLFHKQLFRAQCAPAGKRQRQRSISWARAHQGGPRSFTAQAEQTSMLVNPRLWLRRGIYHMVWSWLLRHRLSASTCRLSLYLPSLLLLALWRTI